MNMIFCVDKNFGIGKDNKMLFNLKTDLQYFKQKTLNKVVVMGYNTLLSLPNSKPLKNRVNIVLTSKKISIENVIVVNNKEQLFKVLKNYCDDDIFIIGGEKIYNLMLPFCKKVFCTKVEATKSADVFAPNLDKNNSFKQISKSQTFEENNLKFNFCEYENKNPLSF